MASLLSLAKPIRSSLFFKPLFSSNPLSSMATHLMTTRSFYKIDTTHSEPWDYDDDVAALLRGYYSKSNALLLHGPRGSYVTKKTDEGMYVRVDVPGVGKEGLKVWVEKDSLCFEAKGMNPDSDGGSKSYAGGFVCCTDTYNLKDADVTLKHGVLRMMIPKNKVMSLKKWRFL